MKLFQKSRSSHTWLAAFLTGTVSAIFSTLLITMGARRIGRDANVNWMEVGTVLLRDQGVKEKPGRREIIAGLIVHHFADLVWATGLFGLALGQLRHYQKRVLLLITLPWAALTAAIEYYLILPWLQPLLREQVPYWTALGVHISSGLAYPVYYWWRGHLDGHKGENFRFGRMVGLALMGLLGSMAGLSLLAKKKEPPWPLGPELATDTDQSFLRRMTWHHEVGLKIARLAAARSIREELRMLARLMTAQHDAELDLMRHWWQSWYDEEMTPLSPQEYQAMKGLPSSKELDRLAEKTAFAFEDKFLVLMIAHHQGAIDMTTEVIELGADPRVKLLADSIRHVQRNQIDRMLALLNGTMPPAALPPTATISEDVSQPDRFG